MINKVLFISEQFYSAKLEHGPNVIDATYRDTLAQSGFVGEIKQLYFGLQYNLFIDELILETCANYLPDAVIFFPTGWPGADPSRQVFDTIRRIFHVPVFIVRGDANSEAGHKFTMSWFPYVDYIMFLDVSLKHLGYGDNPKAIQAIQSFNPQVFFDRKLPKDIDISFIGHLERSPDRIEYINYLRANGINVVTAGGHEKGNISFDEYGSLMSRSKISLNFVKTNLNGRIFEALASKSMVIQNSGTELDQFFGNDEGIVVANNKEDMLQKIKFYLNNDAERQRVTDTGYNKVNNLYNIHNMWAYTFNRAGFKTSGNEYYGEYYTKMESLR